MRAKSIQYLKQEKPHYFKILLCESANDVVTAAALQKMVWSQSPKVGAGTAKFRIKFSCCQNISFLTPAARKRGQL